MTAKLKHLAIVSDNYAVEGRFYEALFGLRTFESRPESAVAVTDGYVGMNVNPRKAGRQAGFDHFGFEVDDVESVFAKARERYPRVQWLRRPANRPFAGISMHDPAGNVFDLSQRGMTNRTDVYSDKATLERTPRHVSHFQLRTVNPDLMAQFYTDLFELEEVEQTPDHHFHLSDGTVTLVLAPWKISDYEGSGIERPALDHIGFEVKSLAEFEKDVQMLVNKNHHLSPSPVGAGPEGQARLKLFERCRYGERHLADPDGVLIDVSERK
jgi:catechol 2,3-dioxygenase-like lactoylglutathione lyase family enzyme